MIGGKVIEICDHPTEDKVYVNVAERRYNKVQECAVFLEKNEESDNIEIGDSLWWHGEYAMWTPQRNCVGKEEQGKKGDKCGVDYDVKIRRIGYSGVNHPYWEKL